MIDRRGIRWVSLLLGLLFAGALHASPEIRHWTTANGARVYFVEARELPMVDLRVVFAAGASRDGGRPGIAALTNGLLDKGAGGLTAQQLAERLEGVGAELGSGSLRDMAWLSLRSLSDPTLLEPALKAYEKVLTAPDFPAKAFERYRARMLVGLEQQKQSPGDIAEKAYYRALYGDHPYASPPSGTEASLKGVNREEVIAFHRRFYVAANAVVAITGDLDRAGAERLAERLTEGLARGERAPALPPVEPLAEGRTIRIHHPSSQSHILIGQPGMRRGDPDFHALHLANHVLGGGGLVSRLNGEIRERRGMAYSVYSYFSPMEAEGPFTMGMQTRNDQAEEARGLMMAQLRDYLAEGAEEKEFEAARRNITGGFALKVDSNSKINGYLALIGFYDLPLDYLAKFNERVEAVDREEARATLARRLDPERMVTVIVGGGGTDGQAPR